MRAALLAEGKAVCGRFDCSKMGSQVGAIKRTQSLTEVTEWQFPVQFPIPHMKP